MVTVQEPGIQDGTQFNGLTKKTELNYNLIKKIKILIYPKHLSKVEKKIIENEIGWLHVIVHYTSNPPRRCQPIFDGLTPHETWVQVLWFRGLRSIELSSILMMSG